MKLVYASRGFGNKFPSSRTPHDGIVRLHVLKNVQIYIWLNCRKKSIPCKEWKGEELRYSSNGRESREKKPNSLGCRKNSVFHSDNLSQIWLCLRIVQLCNAFASLCSFGLCECRFLLFLSLSRLFVCVLSVFEPGLSVVFPLVKCFSTIS